MPSLVPDPENHYVAPGINLTCSEPDNQFLDVDQNNYGHVLFSRCNFDPSCPSKKELLCHIDNHGLLHLAKDNTVWSVLNFNSVPFGQIRHFIRMPNCYFCILHSKQWPIMLKIVPFGTNAIGVSLTRLYQIDYKFYVPFMLFTSNWKLDLTRHGVTLNLV